MSDWDKTLLLADEHNSQPRKPHTSNLRDSQPPLLDQPRESSDLTDKKHYKPYDANHFGDNRSDRLPPLVTPSNLAPTIDFAIWHGLRMPSHGALVQGLPLTKWADNSGARDNAQSGGQKCRW